MSKCLNGALQLLYVNATTYISFSSDTANQYRAYGANDPFADAEQSPPSRNSNGISFRDDR